MIRTPPESLDGGPLMAAFLDAIAAAEIGAPLLKASDNGYNVLVGSLPNHPVLFDDYSRHPRQPVRLSYGWTSAAGRYQIMAAVEGTVRTDTWDWAHRNAGVRDFSPHSQDAVAAYLVKRRGALPALLAGDTAEAFHLCRKEWASLPGAGYGQPEQRMEDMLEVFNLAYLQYHDPEKQQRWHWLDEVDALMQR